VGTKVVLGNLPDDTTVEEVTEVLKKRGWPVLAVDRVDEGSPDKRGFVVEVDMEPGTVKTLTSRKRQRTFKGRVFTVYVPLLMK
jgi:hypothetical protein